MPFTWTNTNDPSHGLRIDTVTNSLGSFQFGGTPWVTIETINTSTRVLSVETTTVGGMPLTGLTGSLSSNFTLTFESSLGSTAFTFDIEGTVDNSEVSTGAETIPVESILLEPKNLTMGAAAKGSLAFHHIALNFNLPVIGNVDDCVIMGTGPTNQLSSWLTVPTTEARWSHPGLLITGGETTYEQAGDLNPDGETGIIFYDEPSGARIGTASTGGSTDPLASFAQWLYFYNRVTEQGVLIRTTDIVGQGKVFSLTRNASDNSINLQVRMIPRDHSIGNNGNSDGDIGYGIEIRPMSGDYYDALVYLREKQKAEGHPAFRKGRIKDRPLVGANMYPEKSRRMLMFHPIGGGDRDQIYANSGRTPPATIDLSAPFSFTQYVSSATRLKSYFELDNWELHCSLYGWWQNYIGTDAPIVAFNTAQGADQAVRQIHRAGITTLMYTIPIAPQKDNLPNTLTIYDSMAKTRVGYSIPAEPGLDADDKKIELETALSGIGNAGVYWTPTFLSVGENREYLQFIRDQFISTIGLEWDGWYYDAHNAYCPPPNDDSTLDPEDRGVGSLTWTPANRALADQARTDLNLDRPVIFSEHPNELYIAEFDFVFDNQGMITALTTSVAQPSTMWSEYTRFTSFDIGTPPSSALYPSGAFSLPSTFNVIERYNIIFSYYFHHGHAASFLQQFGLYDDLYIHYPGEAQYYEWWQDAEEFYKFVKRMYVPLKDKVRNYQISRRLRELPDGPLGFQHRLIIDADILGLIADPNFRVYNSVWYDSDNDVVAVWLTNWTIQSGHPTIVQFSKTITKAKWPELGDGPRNVYLTNAETGAQTLIGTYNSGTGTADEFTFNIQIGPSEVFLIEFVPAGTQVSLSEGSDVATIDADPSSLIHQATRLRHPGYSSFPSVDHFLESELRFTAGVDRVGIWMMGGRKGPDLPVSEVTYDLAPYDYTFHSGSTRPLEQNEDWVLSQEPGQNDPRGVYFSIYRSQNATTQTSHYRLQVDVGDGENFALAMVIAPPSGVIRPDTTLKLRLELYYIATTTAGRTYDISAYVNDQLMLDRATVTFPEKYFTGAGYPASLNIEGKPIYAGIIGQQSGQYAAIGTTVATTWESFTSGITGNVSAPPPGTAPSIAIASGEARPKEHMALRSQVPNRMRNGGFINYPAALEVQRIEGAIDATDPTFVPDEGQLPLHVVVLINGTQSMQGSETRCALSFLEQMVLGLPTDGSVAVTFMAHRDTSSGLYGDVYPSVSLFVPSQVVDAQSVPSITAAIPLYAAGSGQERWAEGLDAVLAELTRGVNVGGIQKTGFRKMVLILDDDGSADVGIRRQEAAAQIDAIHALDGLVACDILSVQLSIENVVGRQAGQGSWDFIFPRPTTQLPNQPLVDTNQSTTNYISTVAVPATTSDALVGRMFDFSDGSANKPSLPIIQNPTLLPITSYPSNAGTLFEYSEWCGYTWAQQIIKRRDAANAQIPAPAQPTVVGLDAYQALPVLEGYSLDIPSETSSTNIGHWEVYGASGSLQIAPLDENDELIPSFDGGNLARINFGTKGEIRLRQEIIDSRPFRGRDLSLAYTGRFFEGRVRVDMILEVDGVEEIFHTAYSSNFGNATRWVNPVTVPLNFSTLAVIIKLTGTTEDAVGLSGIQMALGRYTQLLPYSEPLEDSIIAPGTVVMTLGDTCPAGYREVPNSAGKLAYTVTGDPNFYQRQFVDEVTNGDPGVYVPMGGGTPDPYPYAVDLVFCVDWSSSQRDSSQNNATVRSWIKEMIENQLPRDGSVRVGLVAHGNHIQGGATELFPLTSLDFTTASSLAALVDSLPLSGANGDRYAAGLEIAKQTMEAVTDGGARTRMVFCNFDTTFNIALTDADIVAARDALHSMDRFTNLSIVAVGASRQAMITAGFETFVFPSPSNAQPGVLFAATGGFPGSALPGAFNNQPFLAGEYAARTLGAHVREEVLSGLQFQNITGVGLLDGLGGQKTHEHSEGAPIGASITETDGFEPPLSGATSTPVPVPLGQTAAIKPYPFGLLPSVTRPEDPPVYAVGPGHSHRVATDMEALPPSFPVRYCEKL